MAWLDGSAADSRISRSQGSERREAGHLRDDPEGDEDREHRATDDRDASDVAGDVLVFLCRGDGQSGSRASPFHRCRTCCTGPLGGRLGPALFGHDRGFKLGCPRLLRLGQLAGSRCEDRWRLVGFRRGRTRGGTGPRSLKWWALPRTGRAASGSFGHGRVVVSIDRFVQPQCDGRWEVPTAEDSTPLHAFAPRRPC